MITTIQVKETTKQLLDKVKEKEKLNSYDEIIRNLLQNKLKIPNLFGITKNKPLRFKKEDEMSFNEV